MARATTKNVASNGDGTDEKNMGFVLRRTSNGEIKPLQSIISNTGNLLVWVGGFYMYPLILWAFYFGFYKTGAVALAFTICGLRLYVGHIKWITDFFFAGSFYMSKNSSINFEDDSFLKEGSTPTILAVHPHGCYSIGYRVVFICPEWEASVRPIAKVLSTALMNQPIASFIFRHGSVTSCYKSDKNTFRELLESKKHVSLLPGGFEEATITSTTADRACTDKTGFVYYALKYGYSLTPVYCFNEKRGYHNLQGFWNFRLWLASYGLPTIACVGKWWAPWLPLTLFEDEGVHVVHGKPLPCPTITTPGKPTKQEVEAYRARYEVALGDLYFRNAPKFYKEGTYDPELEIWPRDCPDYRKSE